MSEPQRTPPLVADFASGYQALNGGQTVSLLLRTPDGADLDLRLPAVMLPGLSLVIAEAARAAADLRARRGGDSLDIQAHPVVAQPTVGVASNGVVVVAFERADLLPQAFAISRPQARDLERDLHTALAAAPPAAQPRH